MIEVITYKSPAEAWFWHNADGGIFWMVIGMGLLLAVTILVIQKIANKFSNKKTFKFLNNNILWLGIAITAIEVLVIKYFVF